MENEKPIEQPSSSRDRVRRYRERKRKSNELARQRISPSAIRLALEGPIERVHYPIRIPVIPAGVVPHGTIAQVAMDSEPAYECARLAMDAGPQFGSQLYAYSNIEGFPGYPYLMLLALRSEYRNMATALATELTRKWIKFNSTDTEDESTKTKITEIEQAFTALGIQGIIRKAAEHDAFYGTGQILINIKGADVATPLILSEKTVKKDSLIGFKNVDPIWTTPLMYNSLTPSSPNFYRPDSWWVMGEHWDASRVIVTVTREVPDIFKPAFNFSGMSLSQLAEPYVNNWLRTRQSVSDLINNFSIVVLKTAMDQVLTGGDDGSNLFSRIKLFTATRSNKGVMALDKDREELEQIAVPLVGLHELQSQALEQLCVVSREPATVLTGITPSGFGNVAEGEVRIWYDYIHAQQEAHWRGAIDKMFKIVQMSMYGAIDPEITFEFVPLYEMTEEQESTIRVNDSIRAGNLIDRGIIDAQEERERLARDPESGYQGIDISKEIAPPDEAEEGANLARGTDSALGYDADFVEADHPRERSGEHGGEFTSGSGGAGVKKKGANEIAGEHQNYRGHVISEKDIQERGSNYSTVEERAKYIASDLKVTPTEAAQFAGKIDDYCHKEYAAIRDPKDKNGEVGRQSIEQFIEKSPKWDSNGQLYRGIEISLKDFKGLKPGATIDMRGISSWSSERDAALLFATREHYGGQRSPLIFTIPRTDHGTSIAHLSIIPREHEVIVSSKPRYEVVSVEVKEMYYGKDREEKPYMVNVATLKEVE